MFFLNRFLPVFLLSFVCSGSLFAFCDQNTDIGIQKIIDTARIQYQIPGMEVSVRCSGDEISRDFVSGTTLLDGTVPIAPNHLFQIGSETKSFIATIILQLESERSLSINDPISKYLSHIPQQWNEITIKQLLNHSSGIVNYTDVLEELWHKNNIDFQKQFTSEELVNLVIDKPLYFKPGSNWHYSNTNYVLAGMIIQNITGKLIDEEINSRIIDNLHLSNTYYHASLYDEQLLSQMAHGYSDRGFFPDEPYDITETNISWANTAGAMISTSHDMSIWFKNLLDGTLLPKQQFDEMMTFVDGIFPNSTIPIEYGLGIIHDVETFGTEAWWHSGGTLGYNAMMVKLKSPDVLITINISHTTAKREIYAMVRTIAAYIKKGSE